MYSESPAHFWNSEKWEKKENIRQALDCVSLEEGVWMSETLAFAPSSPSSHLSPSARKPNWISHYKL